MQGPIVETVGKTGVHHTKNQRDRRKKERLYTLFGGCCGYCRRPVGLWDGPEKSRATLDHYMPLALGGTGVALNLWIACWRCNHRKKDMHPDEWFERNPTFNRHRPVETIVTVIA